MVVPSDGVQLLPDSGWWAAWWWRTDRWISVDICTPPALDGSGWSYVDLELDLARLADGTVLLVDEDEFEQTVVECRIPRTSSRRPERQRPTCRSGWPTGPYPSWRPAGSGSTERDAGPSTAPITAGRDLGHPGSQGFGLQSDRAVMGCQSEPPLRRDRHGLP
ncbi:DUF402 domain-containing protein [Streptomyces tuirus]|uniref:DUF402 domain-containing protein n=1 Tax=Streptomyces tuirus TaxID=68278 RepID=A0A941FG08_9ACTN|nr:DUF402 domain-containing protein [Streptomyces tuirus]